MNLLAFDTHRAVKALCEAGAAESLAEAFVETIGYAISGNIVTKADIRESEVTFKAEVANVRAELKTDIGLVQAKIGDLEAQLYRQL